MIFGRGGGGGIVNRVLKRPSFSRRARASRVGRRSGRRRFTRRPRPAAVGRRSALRLNGVYEDSDSFRHHVDLKRYGINPTVALLAGPDTRIDLSYEYFHDRRTADRGVPADGGEPLRGFTRTFFGDPRQQLRQGRRQPGDARPSSIDFGERPDAEEPDDVRRLRQILPEHLRQQRGSSADATLPSASSSAATTIATTARICSARPISSGRTGSPGIDQTLLFGFELGREKSRNYRTDRHDFGAGI